MKVERYQSWILGRWNQYLMLLVSKTRLEQQEFRIWRRFRHWILGQARFHDVHLVYAASPNTTPPFTR
jgi:hypothetical protein